MAFDPLAYWNARYARGEGPGSGSTGRLLDYKATQVRRTIQRLGARTVIEWGCGDGALIPAIVAAGVRYTGVDLSPVALALARRRAPPLTLRLWTWADLPPLPPHDLALSLDVLYHLIDEAMFTDYLTRLFASAPAVLIYAHDADVAEYRDHIRYRAFTPWIAAHAPGHVLRESLPNPFAYDPAHPEQGATTSESQFYFFAQEA